ncbi:hypothetical protein [Sphingobacterium sp. LRF_L2]|uniref:hypothetical protein n=1 Tax=Sphingobacterium sp. LRF_L2 TaxID=3369421 RepID=UPI003F5E1060
MFLPILSNWDYAFFSANLKQIIPAMSWEQHEILFQKWKNVHQQNNESLQKSFHIYQAEELIQRSPGIFVMFHLGNHMRWPIELAGLSISFDVILDREVYNRAPFLFLDLQQQMATHGTEHRFLFSDDSSILTKVRSTLNEGRHLLVFADGASGTKCDLKDDRVAISFFEGHLHLKKGIPYMSFLFRVPIYPLLDRSDKMGWGLIGIEAIRQRSCENREKYVFRALKQLYGELEILLEDDLPRWECWAYLHQNGMLKLGDETADLGRRQEPFLILPFEDRYCVFDRRFYTTQRLNLALKI